MIAKVTMKALCSFIIALLCGVGSLSAAQQWKDTIVVARDGTGDYRTLTEAMEGIRAFMDYKVTVLVKKGVYKEKVILPSWLENVDFIGENVENTIITYDDHANIKKMGTPQMVKIAAAVRNNGTRSEEHTSELQSRE